MWASPMRDCCGTFLEHEMAGDMLPQQRCVRHPAPFEPAQGAE